MQVKRHLSSSQYNCLALCGEAYRRRYILREKKPMGTTQIRGIIFHNIAKKYFRHKQKTANNMSINPLREFLMYEVQTFFTGEIRLAPSEIEFGLGKLQHLMIESILASLPNFISFAKDIMPLEVEVPQILSHPDWEFDIKYVMDLVDILETVYDFKFGKKVKTQSFADTDVGMTTYGLAYFAKYKRIPNLNIVSLASYHTPKKRELKTKISVIPTERDMRDFEILIETIKIIQQSNNAGIYLPAPPGSWKCSPDYCEYWNDCKYINQKRLKKEKENDNNGN